MAPQRDDSVLSVVTRCFQKRTFIVTELLCEQKKVRGGFLTPSPEFNSLSLHKNFAFQGMLKAHDIDNQSVINFNFLDLIQINVMPIRF